MARSKRHIWTKAEDDYLKENYPNTPTKDIAKYLNLKLRQIYDRVRKLKINKSEDFRKSKDSGRFQNGQTGRLTRFKNGDIPWNKNTKGLVKGNKGGFKKGRTPHNIKNDGDISIRNNNGTKYKYIRKAKNKWVLYHQLIWTTNNGEIPDGCMVAFKDKNSMNCAIENLELITIQENMKRNTIHNYPIPVKQAIRKLSKLKKTIKNAEERLRSPK